MPLDRKLLMRTRGRRTLLGPIGAPMLVLETIGGSQVSRGSAHWFSRATSATP